MVKTILLALSILMCGQVSANQDPTAPLDWTKPLPTSSGEKKKHYKVPTLQSIVCEDRGECHAVVNNKIVNKGQYVSGYKVMKITRQQVTVSRDSKQWNLALFSQVKKN